MSSAPQDMYVSVAEITHLILTSNACEDFFNICMFMCVCIYIYNIYIYIYNRTTLITVMYIYI